jgi:AbrB family looped-hinge helix DNA binding protein
MPYYEAKVSSKGQVTIPAAVRDFFDLKTGDTVDFYLDQRTRAVRMRARNRSAASLSGILNKYVDPNAEPVTIEQMNQAVGDYLAEDDARIVRQYREWQEFQRWKQRRRRDAAE